MNYNKIVAGGWKRNLNKYLVIYESEFGKYIKPKYKKSGHVLEIGSGRGELLLWLEGKFYKVTGVEKDRGMFIDKVPGLTKKSNFYNVDIFAFFNKKSKRKIKYDLIILNEVLEHIRVDKIVKLVSLCRKHLNNNGEVIVRSPNAESPFFGSYYRYVDFSHTIAFTRKSAIEFFVAAGFVRDKVKIYPTSHRHGLLYFLNYCLRTIFEKMYSLFLFVYIGKEAFNIIYTPNLVIVAKK